MNCMTLIIPSNKKKNYIYIYIYIYVCVCVCVCVCMYMYNFYLNKLFKFFIILKEIIMIFKTHNKLILNMYNLFSKFYCRLFVVPKNKTISKSNFH